MSRTQSNGTSPPEPQREQRSRRPIEEPSIPWPTCNELRELAHRTASEASRVVCDTREDRSVIAAFARGIAAADCPKCDEAAIAADAERRSTEFVRTRVVTFRSETGRSLINLEGLQTVDLLASGLRRYGLTAESAPQAAKFAALHEGRHSRDPLERGVIAETRSEMVSDTIAALLTLSDSQRSGPAAQVAAARHALEVLAKSREDVVRHGRVTHFFGGPAIREVLSLTPEAVNALGQSGAETYAEKTADRILSALRPTQRRALESGSAEALAAAMLEP
ncbi:MAG: hypothetical protein IT290_10090 [Deltaproteobacteria bacterium]|nr:hypothetical protein [Deltaproteobacteria bacterium]